MFRTEGFRKYLRNTSWMFADRVVRLAAVLLTGVVTARYLGDAGFGQLNYASGFVLLFFTLTSMGLDEIVVRDLVHWPERRDELLGSSAMLKFIGALVLIVLVFVSTFINHMEPATRMMVMIIAASELLKPALVIEYFFVSRVQAKRPAQVNIIQTVVSSGYKLMLVYYQKPLIWFAWSYMVEMIIFAVISIYFYNKYAASLRTWRNNRTTLFYLLQQSWPLIVFGVALNIQARIDQVMIFDVLKHTIGPVAANAEVGQYSVAMKMIEGTGFLPVIIQRSLAPAITRAKQESVAKYEDRLLNQYRLMFLLFIVTAIPLFFLAQPIILFLYGEKFAPAGFLLSLFAIRMFFTNMGVAKSSFITNEGLFKYSLITAVIGAGLNVAINYALIPHFHSIGAIWATIISFLVSIFIVDLFFKAAHRNFQLMMQGIFSFWRFHKAS